VLALILALLGVPVLPFALGMFIPLSLNTPLLVGGAISWLVGRPRKGEKVAVAQARQEKGTLIASGFIAGGALMGVVAAIVKFCGADWYLNIWAGSHSAAVAGLVAYFVLICYFIQAANKK
jgi:uncharacterized oligopeptide transporter (OPT) family protein